MKAMVKKTVTAKLRRDDRELHVSSSNSKIRGLAPFQIHADPISTVCNHVLNLLPQLKLHGRGVAWPKTDNEPV